MIRSKTLTTYECDNCGRKAEKGIAILPINWVTRRFITIDNSYVIVDFCSDDCRVEWNMNHIKSRNK